MFKFKWFSCRISGKGKFARFLYAPIFHSNGLTYKSKFLPHGPALLNIAVNVPFLFGAALVLNFIVGDSLGDQMEVVIWVVASFGMGLIRFMDSAILALVYCLLVEGVVLDFDENLVLTTDYTSSFSMV